jgi:hypothetical protein
MLPVNTCLTGMIPATKIIKTNFATGKSLANFITSEFLCF